MGKPESERLLYISVDELEPNPEQPRRVFEPEALAQLADSIRQYGVITPLTVRRVSGGWQLVAGERRLRAAKLAGLRRVPCVASELDGAGTALVALVENIQRAELDFVEEARGIARLIETWGLTQEETAKRLGRSQSAIANKLRILRLSPRLLDCLRQAGLTERHARALLRLDTEELRLEALRRMVEENMTVATAETYIASLLRPREPVKRQPRIIVRDVRLFYNTVNRGVELLRSAGVNATVTRVDHGGDTVLTVTIPKSMREKPSS